ncbi:MAG TPA: ornithine-acyl-ACP acyltransferase [Rhodobacteraceae bacterium]|nr:ornithine-acyl-ACP acyltransferase [Paracoccaceae bacterium]
MAQKALNEAVLIETGRYRVRLAETRSDLARAQALRARLFRGPAGAEDGDGFDPRCRHVLVEARASGALVCTYRLLDLCDGSRINESYAAQFYELAPLGDFGGPMVEMGRFCIAPEAGDGDVLRLAWAAMTRIVEADGIEMLFGCSSFHGTDETEFLDAFALLKARYIAPRKWRPRVKAPDVFRFARALRRTPDPKKAQKMMPPLLRAYLMMGGWVSDHAVRDRDLGTMHVFTGLEVGRVPANRRRALIGMAGA